MIGCHSCVFSDLDCRIASPTPAVRAPALLPVRIGERCVQFRAKRLEFHRSLECLELVTEIAQPLQSIINIEKSRLPSHRIISDPSVTMESERRQIGEVLRSIHLHVGPLPVGTRSGLW